MNRLISLCCNAPVKSKIVVIGIKEFKKLNLNVPKEKIFGFYCTKCNKRVDIFISKEIKS